MEFVLIPVSAVGVVAFGLGFAGVGLAMLGTINGAINLTATLFGLFTTPFQRGTRVVYRDVRVEVPVVQTAEQVPPAQPMAPNDSEKQFDEDVLDEEVSPHARLRAIVERLREELPLLMEASEINNFATGPSVAVVGIVERVKPCSKGGVIAWVKDLSGEALPVWLRSERFQYPSSGSLLLAEGRIRRNTAKQITWVEADSWGDAEAAVAV